MNRQLLCVFYLCTLELNDLKEYLHIIPPSLLLSPSFSHLHSCWFLLIQGNSRSGEIKRQDNTISIDNYVRIYYRLPVGLGLSNLGTAPHICSVTCSSEGTWQAFFNLIITFDNHQAWSRYWTSLISNLWLSQEINRSVAKFLMLVNFIQLWQQNYVGNRIEAILSNR